MDPLPQLHDLVREIVKAIVDPGEVEVVVKQPELDLVTIAVVVDQTDFGKVMGEKGRTAKAIRSIGSAAAQKLGYKLEVKFAERASKRS